MAGVQTTSGLLAKLGKRLDQAMAKHANETTVVADISGLPPGIKGGVAKLIGAELGQVQQGKTNAGEWYMRLSASVCEPEYFDYKGQHIKCYGKQTSTLVMLCDQVRGGEQVTLEQNIDRALKILRSVTSPSFTAGSNTGQHLINLITKANQMFKAKGAGFFVNFSTTPRKDQKTGEFTDECWENWNGNEGLQSYKPPMPGSSAAAPRGAGMPVDRTARGVSDNGATAATASHAEETAAANGEAEAGLDAESGGGDEAGGSQEFNEFGDIDSLVQQARDGDMAARKELKEQALARGMSEEDFDAAEDWQDVGNYIMGGGNAGEGGTEGEGGEAGDEAAEEPGPEVARQPKKGDVYFYAPTTWDTKAKKAVTAKKAVECQVLTVDVAKRTVTLQNLDTKEKIMTAIADPKKRTILPVSWDKLQQG